VLQFENLKNWSEDDKDVYKASLTPVGDQTMVVEWFYEGDDHENVYSPHHHQFLTEN
jgi:hypothetical protein